MVYAYVVGSAAGCVSGFLFGCLNHAPWGGLIVLPVVDNRVGYFLSVMIGALVVAFMMKFLKKDYIEEAKVADEVIEENAMEEITFEDF